jgi:hypothetical protein
MSGRENADDGFDFLEAFVDAGRAKDRSSAAYMVAVHNKLKAQAEYDLAFAKHQAEPNASAWKVKQAALQTLSARSSEAIGAECAMIAAHQALAQVVERTQTAGDESAPMPPAKPIQTDEGHADALREIEGIMHAEAGTPEGERLNHLAAQVEEYEAKRWPIAESRRHWNYRIVRHHHEGEEWFGLHEVHYENGRPIAVTENPITFVCDGDEGPKAIARALERALLDAETRPVLDETEIGGKPDE